jgi:hypothetical protein
MQRINVDTIGPFPEDKFGFKYILTIIDTFSRWTSVYPTRTTTAQEAAIALLQHIAVFGTPSQILTDNGSQFMNELFSHLFRLLGTEGIKTIPYSKEENTIVERANKEIQRHLEALCYDRDHSESWSLYLPIVQRILNASVHSSTGQKPATLLFANLIDLDKGIFLPLDELPPPDSITNIPEWLDQIYKASQALLSLAKSRQDEINNDNLTSRQSKRLHRTIRTPTTSIQIGDTVLYDRPDDTRPKLELARRGPVIVTDVARDEVTIADNNGHHKRVRISRIVPYHTDSATQVQISQHKDTKKYIVEKILGYRKVANKKGKNQYLFKVKWEGYEDSDNTEEPYHHMQNNTVWREWAISHKNHFIRALVPK